MDTVERFLKYVSFPTTSDGESGAQPSSPGQLVLGKYIADELAEIGLEGAHMDELGYVYAFLPASKGCEELPAIGFISHMDTSPDASGENIKPRVVLYEGGDINLSGDIYLRPKDFPSLNKYVGKELIVTDGTTLLGADDKAGVAEIVSACEYLIAHPEIPHRAVSVCFTPDEEIGGGAKNFTFEKFAAKMAYTVDGGEIGEIEYENFNAGSAKIEINGVNIHPGSAKDKMKNAVLLASEFISLMPPAETPAHTEGYEGFYHISQISGNTTHASLGMIIREHDAEKYEARKAFLMNLVAYLNSVHGEDTFTITLRDGYKNMKEKILPHFELITNAEAAMIKAGAEPKIIPVRGGTDGAELSYRGLPCPNLCTGGENFHSNFEYIPVFTLDMMKNVIINLTSPEAKI